MRLKFKVGDEVVSFRGEKATVIGTKESFVPGKSNRVSVKWEKESRNPDKREYYEEVFSAR